MPQQQGKTVGCKNCTLYQEITENYLIIEAGGLGSALRTSTVTKTIRSKNPTALIQWLTAERNVELAKNIPSIDRAYAITWENLTLLNSQSYTTIINFESQPLLLKFVREQSSIVKGFTGGDYGQLVPADANAYELLRLQTDDAFRKRYNKKSMQQLLLETAGYPWRKQNYDLVTLPDDNICAINFFKRNNICTKSSTVIGLNIGSSIRHAAKRWSPSQFYELAKLCAQKKEWIFVVLAGPDDIDAYHTLQDLNHKHPLKNLFFSVYDNTLGQFISLIARIPVVISADTFGLHVALRMSKKVISLWGPQPKNETFSYRKEFKIHAGLGCAPCFAGMKNECTYLRKVECMKQISIDKVYNTLKYAIGSLTKSLD